MGKKDAGTHPFLNTCAFYIPRSCLFFLLCFLFNDCCFRFFNLCDRCFAHRDTAVFVVSDQCSSHRCLLLLLLLKTFSFLLLFESTSRSLDTPIIIHNLEPMGKSFLDIFPIFQRFHILQFRPPSRLHCATSQYGFSHFAWP